MTFDPWSAQARLLPVLEQANLENLIDWRFDYSVQPVVPQTRVPTFVCPSEVNDRARVTSSLTHYPLNYGMNLGTWFVFDPNTQQGGNGMAYPNSRTNMASIPDGTSNTLALRGSEGLQPILAQTVAIRPRPIFPFPAARQKYLPSEEISNPTLVTRNGWTVAQHQTGFTGTFPPNTVFPFVSGGETFDVDFNSSREGKTTDRRTYAVVTSRSYHSQGVQVVLADGSGRFVAETVDVSVWRALSTRDRGEVVVGEF